MRGPFLIYLTKSQVAGVAAAGVAAAFGVCLGVAAEFGSEGTAVANKCFEEALSYACTGGELAFDERTQVVLLHFTQNYSCDLLAPTY